MLIMSVQFAGFASGRIIPFLLLRNGFYPLLANHFLFFCFITLTGFSITCFLYPACGGKSKLKDTSQTHPVSVIIYYPAMKWQI